MRRQRAKKRSVTVDIVATTMQIEFVTEVDWVLDDPEPAG
jgi:hypothetical protein